MPSLDEFFAEAIEQADPANMVEDEYKYVCTDRFPVKDRVAKLSSFISSSSFLIPVLL